MLGTRLGTLRENVELRLQKPKDEDDNSNVNVPVNTEVLNGIDVLLQKNSSSLQSLLQEREKLKEIEQVLKETFNSNRIGKSGKENKPANENISRSQPTSQHNNKISVAQNSIIEELRSSIKFLKTPIGPSRHGTKSIILTPRSMSFSIQKQIEDLLEI